MPLRAVSQNKTGLLFCAKLHSTEMVVIDEQNKDTNTYFQFSTLLIFPQFAHSSEQELKSRKKSFKRHALLLSRSQKQNFLE